MFFIKKYTLFWKIQRFKKIDLKETKQNRIKKFFNDLLHYLKKNLFYNFEYL